MDGETHRNVDFYLDVPDPTYPGCYHNLHMHSRPDYLGPKRKGMRRFRVIVPLPHDNPLDETVCVQVSEVEEVEG